jgi:hypothetical protein
LNYDSHFDWRNRGEHNKAFKFKELLIGKNVQTFSLVEFPISPHSLPMHGAHMSATNLPTIKAE